MAMAWDENGGMGKERAPQIAMFLNSGDIRYKGTIDEVYNGYIARIKIL